MNGPAQAVCAGTVCDLRPDSPVPDRSSLCGYFCPEQAAAGSSVSLIVH